MERDTFGTFTANFVGNNGDSIVFAMIRCPSYNPDRSLHEYAATYVPALGVYEVSVRPATGEPNTAAQATPPSNTAAAGQTGSAAPSISYDGEFNWMDEADELEGLYPTDMELEMHSQETKSQPSIPMDVGGSSTREEQDIPVELQHSEIRTTASTAEPDPNVNYFTNDFGHLLNLPNYDSIHHWNFQGIPMKIPSATPPEDSLWFALRYSELPTPHHEFGRQRVLLGQATKLIDPVQYTGSGDIPLVTGSQLQASLRSCVQKAYINHGTWQSEVVEDESQRPLGVDEMDVWTWHAWTSPAVPAPARGEELQNSEYLINDDGRVHHSPKSDWTVPGLSNLCYVETDGSIDEAESGGESPDECALINSESESEKAEPTTPESSSHVGEVVRLLNEGPDQEEELELGERAADDSMHASLCWEGIDTEALTREYEAFLQQKECHVAASPPEVTPTAEEKDSIGDAENVAIYEESSGSDQPLGEDLNDNSSMSSEDSLWSLFNDREEPNTSVERAPTLAHDELQAPKNTTARVEPPASHNPVAYVRLPTAVEGSSTPLGLPHETPMASEQTKCKAPPSEAPPDVIGWEKGDDCPLYQRGNELAVRAIGRRLAAAFEGWSWGVVLGR